MVGVALEKTQFGADFFMFTGLIEAVCTARSVRQGAGTAQLVIDLGELATDTKIGDSIAINGVCLTVARIEGGLATFEVSEETLAKSAIGRLRASSLVNVERAMKATDRFGGHFVQGHVDGTVTISAIERTGQFANVRCSADNELLGQMIVKGSVAIDGISLTVASMDERGFGVAVIPETLEKTTLGQAKIGDIANVEIDIIVKVIKKQLESILGQEQKLTVDKLKEF